MLKLASDLFFVVFLTVDTVLSSQLDSQHGHILSLTKAILLAWILGEKHKNVGGGMGQ